MCTKIKKKIRCQKVKNYHLDTIKMFLTELNVICTVQSKIIVVVVVVWYFYLCDCLIPKWVGSCQHKNYAKNSSFLTVTAELRIIKPSRTLSASSWCNKLSTSIYNCTEWRVLKNEMFISLTECKAAQSRNIPFGVNTTTELKIITPTSDNNGILRSMLQMTLSVVIVIFFSSVVVFVIKANNTHYLSNLFW